MAQHKYYRLDYPPNTTLSDDKLERWFMEALAANEIGLDYISANDLDIMAEALEDAGIIRLQRRVS